MIVRALDERINDAGMCQTVEELFAVGAHVFALNRQDYGKHGVLASHGEEGSMTLRCVARPEISLEEIRALEATVKKDDYLAASKLVADVAGCADCARCEARVRWWRFVDY